MVLLFVQPPQALPETGEGAVRELLGWGRSGRVERLGPVVIKRLPGGPDPGLAQALVQAWGRLARAACPSLLVPYAVAVGGDGLAVVMPFAPGGSLAARPGAELGSWLPAVAQALDAAHAMGVVHGDLKATDVLFGHEGAVVSDFGLDAVLGGDRRAGEPSRRRDLRALAGLCLEAVAGPGGAPPARLAPGGRAALEEAAWGEEQEGPGSAAELAAAVLAARPGAPAPGRVILPRAPAGAGPRPAGRRARSALALAAATALAAGLGGAGVRLAGEGRPEGGSCPVRPAVAGPLDGGACGAAYSSGRAEATLYFSSRRPQVVRLGQPGDRLVVGDWTCSGRRDPALYRPRDGLVLYFPGWSPGLGAYARAEARPGGHPVVRRAGRPGAR
ncbi:MAG TPA: hypothetical protein VKY15_00570, partial [Acidimicrobiales bacterium]|nr:hypothetical protein [Acidimicrobiales bacterium]